MWSNSTSPERSRIWCFYPLTLCWAGRSDYDKYLCANPNNCLCSQWFSGVQSMPDPVSALRQVRQKPVPLEALEKFECWTCGQTFPPPGKSQSWGFSSKIMALCQRQGFWWEGIVHFPTSFNVAGFMFTPNAGAFQVVSGFLTKWICPCILVELVYPHGE